MMRKNNLSVCPESYYVNLVKESTVRCSTEVGSGQGENTSLFCHGVMVKFYDVDGIFHCY